MRTTLVLGAASGIGKGLADEMHNIGFVVIRADLAFPKESHQKLTRYVDATDEESIAALTHFFAENYGALDCLVITIGAIDEGRVADYKVQELSWMIDINLLSVYRFVQNFIPFLRLSTKPRILLTGSAAGLGAFESTNNLMPYIISKHALIGYFKALRDELSFAGFQVSLFLPNRIKGELSKNSAEMRRRFFNQSHPSIKGMQPPSLQLVAPEKIAKEVVEKFLAGKSYISNNPSLIVDKLQSELSEIKKELLDE
ncbi:SDR family NAD(P)-dependent oxidoreductase [Sphingobacterium oryzagri]|uniref:SDR family NAD(P)-dependent oxidoreductase n=1 Tax=Sphingobacterium oryzagri TaxID=3025669 RepID=A0ABY7WAX7_9SPHI|nr:SDR family oxidoreductase [Sphingobacterium sp. KACC 22765]WDF66799.1 SDR family NAD(P)-dependent oxidoreductase [Sphingobacterium sp. KACC 22765]